MSAKEKRISEEIATKISIVGTPEYVIYNNYVKKERPPKSHIKTIPYDLWTTAQDKYIKDMLQKVKQKELKQKRKSEKIVKEVAKIIKPEIEGEKPIESPPPVKKAIEFVDLSKLNPDDKKNIETNRKEFLKKMTDYKDIMKDIMEQSNLNKDIEKQINDYKQVEYELVKNLEAEEAAKEVAEEVAEEAAEELPEPYQEDINLLLQQESAEKLQEIIDTSKAKYGRSFTLGELKQLAQRYPELAGTINNALQQQFLRKEISEEDFVKYARPERDIVNIKQFLTGKQKY
jgi:hypothetical protein